MKVKVLRLGHRAKRDIRLTTHVCLTARALGANEVIISGEKDKSVIDSVKDVSKRWGGNFKISYEKNWKKTLKNYEVIHLTMYGEPIQNKIKEIRKSKKNKLIVVGSEKVPKEIYNLTDYNIAVTNQPHSEVAALSIFLHELFQGKELKNEFKNAEIKIKPKKHGKKVIRNKSKTFIEKFPFFNKK